MAHAVVIMAYDKSPAINKAVQALEEAGMEVIVLNTATAKLVNFLGALAGEADADDDSDDADKADEMADETADAADEASAEDKTADAVASDEATDTPPSDDADLEEDPTTSEGMVEGETVKIKLVEGSTITLHPTSIVTGAKTHYTLNESQFSFWPSAVSDEPITGGLTFEYNGNKYYASAIFSEEISNPPTLEIGRDFLKNNI